MVAPTEPLVAAAAIFARRRAPPAAPRRRGRRAAAGVHDPRRAALRRDVTDARRRLTWFGARRWQVELHTLAESSALAAAGTIAGWALGGGVAAVVATRAGLPAWRGSRARTPLARRPRSAPPASPPVRRPAALRDGACARGATRPPVVHTARRGSLRRGRRRARRLGARLGRRAAAGGRQRHERVPPPRAGADRVRGRGRRGPPARADAARARPRGASRPDRAAARRRLAGAQSRARGDRRNVPRREPRARAVRRRVPLDAPARAARRGAFAVPASFVLSEDLSQLVPVLHGAPRRSLPGTPTPVLRLSGNVPSGATFAFLAPAGSARLRPCGVGGPTSRANRSPRSARSSRRAPPDSAGALPPGRPAVHPAGGGNRRRRRHSGALPLPARRLRGRRARAHRGARTTASCFRGASHSGTRRSRSSSSTF